MNSETKYNLIIVDDHKEFLESISILLGRDKNFNILGCFSSATELLKSDNLYHADIILMDIKMPDLNGFDATRKILSIYRDKKVIAITSCIDTVYLEDFISIGFKGCVFKDDVYQNIKNAINKILDGGVYFPKEINL